MDAYEDPDFQKNQQLLSQKLPLFIAKEKSCFSSNPLR